MKLKPNIASMEEYSPGRSIPGAVKLSSNENPLGPSPLALQAIRDALDGIHRYPDGAASALKEKLAERWKIDTGSLLVANGSDEVFTLLAAAWIGPDENAVGIRETFSEYRFAVKLFGGTMKEAPLADGRFNLESMISLIDDHTRMAFICNPNNPTGTYRSHEEIVSFLRRVPEGVITVLDEAYAEFADAPDFPDSRSLMDDFPDLVVTRTFSKLYGLAGLRVGYAMGRPEIISGAGRASMPFNVNNLAQAAALAALDDVEHLEATLKLVRDEKAYLDAEFSSRGISHYPTQANFLCFGFTSETAALWEPIALRGISLRDLKSFGLPRMARYTFGTRENNRRLLEILDEVIPG